jgi:hypothetical protein
MQSDQLLMILQVFQKKLPFNLLPLLQLGHFFLPYFAINLTLGHININLMPLPLKIMAAGSSEFPSFISAPFFQKKIQFKTLNFYLMRFDVQLIN